MIRTFLSIAVLTAFSIGAAFGADPSPKPSSKKTTTTQSSTKTTQKTNSSEISKMSPATPLTAGWSLVNGVWTHSDGYKLVNGQVVRGSAQTHKPAPKPPTPAEMQAVTKKKVAPKTAAEAAAEKEAQRQRNLAPRPASQTGTRL